MSHLTAKSTTKFAWIKPDVYPLFIAVGAACGLSVFCISRNLMINPDVSVSKDRRMEGYNGNFKEGESYRDHGIRGYVRSTGKGSIMQGINEAMTK